jgi:hypothetical protein
MFVFRSGFETVFLGIAREFTAFLLPPTLHSGGVFEQKKIVLSNCVLALSETTNRRLESARSAV